MEKRNENNKKLIEQWFKYRYESIRLIYYVI